MTRSLEPGTLSKFEIISAIMDSMQFVVVGVVAVLGIVLTVIYYFARYYFKTHEHDDELAASVKKKLDEKAAAGVPVAETEIPASLPKALEKTRGQIWGRLSQIFSLKPSISEADMEALEEVLFTSDIGVQTTQKLMESLQTSWDGDRTLEGLRSRLKTEMMNLFSNNPSNDNFWQNVKEKAQANSPQIWMVVGVNGVGKTTTIGKLAFQAGQEGLKTLVVAGDTFRAAAGEQLKVWSERAGVEIFNPTQAGDPSGVAFDGCQKGIAQKFDLVIVDTAGRLHTQDHLMEELKKIKRVIQKVKPDAPHEVLIVLDANSGQNALQQARAFNQTLGLTGAIMTKMDGTAKGGVALGLASEVKVPIRLIGIGEKVQDLRSFKVEEFVSSIL